MKSRKKTDIPQDQYEIIKQKSREYYWKNRQKVLDRKREERLECSEKIKARKREYYEKNRDEILRKKSEYFKENRATIGVAHRRHYEDNKLAYAIKSKEYRKKNKERLAQYIRDNRDKIRIIEQKRYAKIKYKLSKNMSCRMRLSLLDGKCGRHWEDIVGYTVEELMNHLGKLFKPGMSWDNKKDWHIDHIRPVSAFDFSSIDDVQFRECWSLDNLQPLWAFENQSKGGVRKRVSNE